MADYKPADNKQEKRCVICGEIFPQDWLDRRGQCEECVDHAEAFWGF